MGQKDPRQIQAGLAMPFAPDDLEWRLQRVIETRELGIAVPYVTNRAIMSRLDDVVGPENWYNDFKPWHGAGGKEAQLCGISIRFGDEWITKWDGAEDSDIEPVKGGLSDSMKRAAVQWGIGGRVLYSMDTVWVDIEKLGRSWIIKKSERAKLDKAYTDTLSKMKLTPAPAGGVQSTLTPKQTKEAPAPAPAAGQQATPPPVQPLPRSKTDSKAGIYTVIAARLENRPNSTTHALLEGPDKKQIHAFAIGERSELVAGTQLTGVKLELQKQDTVAFYILRDYRIVAHQDQAA